MSGSFRRKIGWPIAIALLPLLLAAGFWYYKKVEQERQEQRIAQAKVLSQLKNLGLGQLENAEAFEGHLPLATDAKDAFLKIAEARPDLLLGPRNLTLAHLISIAGGASPDRLPSPGQPPAELVSDEKLTDARAAVERLQQVDPDSPITSILAARIETVAGDFSAARKELAAAAIQRPDEAWVSYERFRLDRFSPQDELREEARDALGKAYEVAPQNLWLAREWLLVLAERRSSTIATVLSTVSDVLRPLVEGIQQRTRVDVTALIDQATEAVEKEDWPAVTRNVRGLVNVIIQEEQVQSDKLAVDRNALEFVAVDFPQEFYRSNGISRRPVPEEIPVEFSPGMFDTSSLETTGLLDVAVDDFDLDGLTDLAVLSESQLVVTRFVNDSPQELMSYNVPPGFQSLIAADLDADSETTSPAPAGLPCHDADPDVVLFGPEGLLVLENRRDADSRTFIPVEQNDEFNAIKGVRTAAFADFDLDGDLDLVVSADQGMSLWANVGGLKFENRTSRSSLPPFAPTKLLPVDIDRDVDIDILLCGADGPAGYLENLRHGNLRWRPCDANAVANAIEIIDADGNASWDLLAATDQGLALLRTQTSESGRWTVASTELVSEDVFESFLQFDYDNDGLPDLLARTAAGKPVLLRNVGEQFESTKLLGDFPEPLIDADFADFDGDGDLDLVLASVNKIHLLENRGGNANHWIDVSLLAQQVKGGEASQSGRVNHRGLGSLLELKSGALYSPAVVRRGLTHFGLGKDTQADVVRVVWTNGIPQNVLEPVSKQFICEKQSLKGSCPYLYTFDGEKFVFSTDLLWSAPIGLQFAEGVIAPTRAWEYLKLTSPIRPDKNGEYLFQITEELWEAAYFDHVELIAVDHPPQIDIFTNEKVGPAEIAMPRLHTVQSPRPPLSARDGKGRDVTSELTRADDRYVKAFDKKYVQGLCEPHAIELDFGDLASANRITLFLTGWIYPSDTSINVALGQRKDLPAQTPPSLSVRDERGHWVEVLPYMGFPGGKTKTIAVDLTDKFLSDDRRIRIQTTMEIYWDAAFVTVDEPAVALLTRECPLVGADLHYRGISAAIPHPQYGPERYDYADYSTDAAWPPMRGSFTRYGDVSELLTQADDRQVVMSSGDEITLRFSSPGPPPQGWTRSFLLHNVGYDKDADLNTVYGQSSEPLPFRAMKNYPYEPTQSFPNTAEHRQYLDQYQTRQQQQSFWQTFKYSGF